jgi:hypothetical protein
VSRARKVTLDSALPHRLPNQAQPSAAAPGGGLSNQAVMSEDHNSNRKIKKNNIIIYIIYRLDINRKGVLEVDI